MPSDFISPFQELEQEFCKSLGGLDSSAALFSSLQQRQRILGFQRRHSLCPVTLPNSKFNHSPSDPPEPAEGTPTPERGWPWEGPQLPASALTHIPFRVDRSVSLIEAPLGLQSPLPPPPGLSFSSLSSPRGPPPAPSPPLSARYKTELCRTFQESGACKYGAKCQFAHGAEELRDLNRHPKYKTEPCRTFHTVGFCPYGARCHFVHNAEDEEAGPGAAAAAPGRPALRHSLSFAGFPTPQGGGGGVRPVARQLSALPGRAASVSPPPSAGSPDVFFAAPRGYPFSRALAPPLFGGLPEAPPLFGNLPEAPPLFSGLPEAPPLHKVPPGCGGAWAVLHRGPAGMKRCSSADSLSEEDYTSSSSASGSESPDFEGRRLPIFSRLSVSDD